MNAKTIRRVLRKRWKDFMVSIPDPELAKYITDNGIVTGGAIVSLLLGERVNDLDVYFKDLASAQRVAEYYVQKFKENPPEKLKLPLQGLKVRVENGRIRVVVQSAGVASEEGTDSPYQYFEGVASSVTSEEFVEEVTALAEEAQDKDKNKDKPKYRPVFLTSNAITLSNGVQLVTRFYGDIETIHENYDFVHCTCSWDTKTGELQLPPAALEAILARELRYKSSKYPLCSLIRTRKFLRRGWHINAGQYLKMGWELNKLDLSDLDVLEDQLTGVDTAYFLEVLEALRKRNPKEVDGTYLMQLVDKIF